MTPSVHMPSRMVQIATTSQRDLNTLSDCSLQWNLIFNQTKYVHVTFLKPNSNSIETSYHLNESHRFQLFEIQIRDKPHPPIILRPTHTLITMNIIMIINLNTTVYFPNVSNVAFLHLPISSSGSSVSRQQELLFELHRHQVNNG